MSRKDAAVDAVTGQVSGRTEARARRRAGRRAGLKACGPCAALGAIAWALVPVSVAAAQEQAEQAPPASAAADAPADTAEGPGIQDIVVTAQRRSENVQSVPIAITAIGADYLESRDVSSLEQIGSLAPNVKIERAPGNKTTAQIAIRGSVTINPAITFEPAVGLYLDGVYIAKAQGAIFDLVDLERIEVLRGPQGTLYGRNTLAGAISLVTRKPTGVAGGSIEATYGRFNERRIKATIDLPRLGIFSVKVSGQVQKRDGFIDIVPNPYPAAAAFAAPPVVSRTNNLNGYGVLAQVRADLADNLQADYTFDYGRTRQLPNFSQLYSVTRNGAAGDIFDPASAGYSGIPLYLFASRERQRTGSLNTTEFERNRIQGHALTVSWDVGGVTAKSISAYRKMSYGDSLDLDGTPLLVATASRLTKYHAFSQELQLTGKALDDRLTYVVGAYYFDDRGFTNNPQVYFFGQIRPDSRYGAKTRAIAGYGQVDWTVTPGLTLTGGLRYNHESKEVMRFLSFLPALGSTAPAVTLIDIPYGQIPKVSYNDLSPAATLRYEFDPAISVYARYARGFKSGGFNAESSIVGAPTANCPTGTPELCAPYRPETVNSYEAGLKSRLLDNTLQLNLAAFWDEHKDIQLSVFQGGNSAASLVLNAGAARIRGVELEMLVKPARTFTFNGSFAYLEAHYRQFIDGGVNVADNRAFPHVPKFTINLGTDWTVAEGSFGKAQLIADLSFLSDYYTFPYALRGNSSVQQLAATTRSPGRTVVNLRGQVAEIPVGSARATVSLFVRNLFGEDAPTNFIDFGPGFGGLTVVNFTDPRTFGITAGLRL